MHSWSWTPKVLVHFLCYLANSLLSSVISLFPFQYKFAVVGCLCCILLFCLPSHKRNEIRLILIIITIISHNCIFCVQWSVHLCLYLADSWFVPPSEYESFLLFSKVTSIESILLADNLTNLNPPKEPIKPEDPETMQNVIGLSFDLDTRRLFFSDIQRGDIQSVLFNNTDYRRICASKFTLVLSVSEKQHPKLFGIDLKSSKPWNNKLKQVK